MSCRRVAVDNHNDESNGQSATDLPGYKTWQRIKIFSVGAVVLAILIDYLVK